jgi:hypothetical protein
MGVFFQGNPGNARKFAHPLIQFIRCVVTHFGGGLRFSFLYDALVFNLPPGS